METWSSPPVTWSLISKSLSLGSTAAIVRTFSSNEITAHTSCLFQCQLGRGRSPAKPMRNISDIPLRRGAPLFTTALGQSVCRAWLVMCPWRTHALMSLPHTSSSARCNFSALPCMKGSKTPQTQPTRAAAYVRMSTRHQQYSTSNQLDVIREYAAQRHMEIVRIYSDEGKSGLNIRGREAFCRMLDDVKTGRADFSCILVYDVSRRGRFQDQDERGITSTPAGAPASPCITARSSSRTTAARSPRLSKGSRASMSSEYSRELSTKVFQGACRLIQLGFKQGGTAGYGLRPMLVDSARQHKGTLKIGEHKSIQTDRVILVPRPVRAKSTQPTPASLGRRDVLDLQLIGTSLDPRKARKLRHKADLLCSFLIWAKCPGTDTAADRGRCRWQPAYDTRGRGQQSEPFRGC